ncbi:AAA family ATPase [Paraburkholderia youngii]|uniref:AAA family ATPase n=1 Tax=Paraburkholderia youngii TaxID=2782701 RepID=UPI00158FDDBD|nr:AAA family ATPase [Paraburkholderia youngii]NUX57669.1 AAA family ATPase [Paraburkholderia youngii]
MAHVTRQQPALYPPGLEHATTKEKLEFFEGVIIEHDLFDDTLEQIDDHAKSGLRGSMVVLVGPAGAGKSSIGDTACSRMNREFFELFPDDLHTIPAALIEAWSPEFDKFDWQDFYELILTVLQVPLIADTLPEVRRVIAGRELVLPLFPNAGRPTLRDLRQRLRRAVSDRRPSMLFVDEASSVLVSPRQGVRRQANTLRSIVNKVHTLLVLSGAYDLYDLVLETGQLARRGQVVHMRGYFESELEPFGRALIALQNCMPLDPPCNLENHVDRLAEQSLRTVGHLKYILLRALGEHCRTKQPIDGDMLERAFYKPAQLETMRNEMYDGYWKVEQRRHPDDHRVGDDQAPAASKTGDDKVPKTGRKAHVGKPKPSRKPIGQ